MCMSTSAISAAASPSSDTSRLAPELYARQGDVSKMTNIQEIVDNVVKKASDAQVVGDLDAAVCVRQGVRQGGRLAFGCHRFLLGRAHGGGCIPRTIPM